MQANVFVHLLVDSLMSDHPNVQSQQQQQSQGQSAYVDMQSRSYAAATVTASSSFTGTTLEITQRDAKRRCQQLKAVSANHAHVSHNSCARL